MLIQILWIAQTVISLLLIFCVLLQSKDQGLSTAFGGTSQVYRTRRGADKLVFNATIALGVLFPLLSLVIVVLSH